MTQTHHNLAGSPIVLRMALGKRYEGFQIALVPV